jgi:hypothetical protein
MSRIEPIIAKLPYIPSGEHSLLVHSFIEMIDRNVSGVAFDVDIPEGSLPLCMTCNCIDVMLINNNHGYLRQSDPSLDDYLVKSQESNMTYYNLVATNRINKNVATMSIPRLTLISCHRRDQDGTCPKKVKVTCLILDNDIREALRRDGMNTPLLPMKDCL